MAQSGSDSARRALELFFAFEKHPQASIKELAAATGIPLPTAHRYVAMLRDMGLVEEARQGVYRLTMRVAALANTARRATSIIETVQPHMRALSDELGETVLLVQHVAGMPVCVHRVETPKRLRLSFEVGQRMPALRGASAHLLLSSIPSDAREDYVHSALESGEEPPVDGDLAKFLSDSQRDGDRGWATSTAEIDEGVWSAAALIKAEGRAVGTLSVPCLSYSTGESRREAIIAATIETAARINFALGS